MLLPGDRVTPSKTCVARASPAADVAALDGRLGALEALGRDRLLDGHQRRQRLVVDLDRRRAEPRGLEGLAEHPADRVAEEHDLGGEQRLVVLDARRR